jgi:hypothetical protein
MWIISTKGSPELSAYNFSMALLQHDDDKLDEQIDPQDPPSSDDEEEELQLLLECAAQEREAVMRY